MTEPNNSNNRNSPQPDTLDFYFNKLKLSFEIWYGLFFPNELKKLREKFPNSNIVLSYINSLLRLVLLIFILPAIPFIIILTICLEGFRYFFSKFILL